MLEEMAYFLNIVRPILCRISKARLTSECGPQPPAVPSAHAPGLRGFVSVPQGPDPVLLAQDALRSHLSDGWMMGTFVLEINPSLVFEMMELASPKVSFAFQIK